MADNILSIVFQANISALQDSMQQASAVVGRTVKDITTAAATMPAGVEAAAAEAGAALGSFAPQIQAQATRVLDLKAAQTQLNQSIKETEAMVAEEGSAQEVGASIIQNYSRETLAAAVNQQRLNAAVADYKALLNEAYEAQLRLAAAPKAGPIGPIVEGAVVAPAAEGTGIGAAEAGAAGVAAGAAGAAGEAEADRTAEAAVLGVESVTAAKEAEIAAKESDAAASEHDAAAEVTAAEAAEVDAAAETTLTESILAGLVGRNQEIAATAAGMVVLRDHAAATAQLTGVRQAQAGITARTAVQEEELRAAEARQMQTLTALGTAQREVTASRNAGVAAAQAQALATVEASAAETRVAAATVAHSVAQAELNSLQEIAISMGGTDAKVMNELAVAQLRVRATAFEMAEAQKVANAEFTKGQSVLEGFRMRVIAGENGMRSFITSSLTSVPLMIGALVTGFVIHAVDAIKDTIIELDNLSRMTGISVQSLGSMGRAAEEAGAKSEDLTQMFRRLDRTISDAMSGGKQAQLTLKELGIDVNSLATSANPTLTALAQMQDYLHANAGSAEVMRAAMRALGTDSVALAAFMARGAQGVREASEKYAEFGKELQDNVAAARSLEAEQKELSQHWDEFKIAILPAVNGLLKFGEAAVRTIEIGAPVVTFLKDMANTWNLIAVATGLATKADADYMAQAMKEKFAPPGAPPTVTHKPETATHATAAVPSIMPELREELAQQEATFQGSRSDMLRMEVMFWDQVIETGRAKGKDLIAAKRDLFKTEIELRRETNSEVMAEDTTLASLAKQGSADRVALEQKAANDAKSLYGEESREYARAQESLMLSKKSQVEEEIRLDIEATGRSVALYKAGSVEKIRSYDLELASLATYLEAADSRSMTGSDAQKIIARSEADFIIEQIRRITIERSRSVEENKSQLAGQEAKDIEKAAAEQTSVIKEEQKIEDAYYASAKSQIDDLASHDLISKTTKIQMINAVEAAEYKVAQATLRMERSELEAEAAAIRGLQGQEDKYQEIENKITAIDGKILESSIKRNQQIAASNIQLYTQQLGLFDHVWTTMQQSFQQNIDKMISGAETFSTGMLKVWGQIVAGVRNFLIQMLLDYAKHEAAKLLLSVQASVQRHVIQQVETAQTTIMEGGLVIVHANAETAKVAATAAGEAGQTAARTAGTTAGIAQSLFQTIKVIGQKAAQAAAGAFSWVMTNVPFPANVVLAPAAAGAAFAGVMAFTALASAAGGAEIPHDMIAQVHKNEMILPANISAGLKGMISESSSSLSNKTGGDVHMTYAPSVSALDSKGVKEVLSGHSDEVSAAIRRMMRNGKLVPG